MSELPDFDELDWFELLSPDAKASLDKIDLRQHKVSLERVQRIHLNIDDEKMEFSALTLAAMLADIADRSDEDEAFLLRGVVNALRGDDEHHELILKQRRKGRFVSPTAYSATHNRNRVWLSRLAYLENEGWPTEAAVQEIATKAGVKRATVFAAIKAAEKYLADGKTMFPESPNFKNPRPSKSGKA